MFANPIPQKSYQTFLPLAVAFKSFSMISSNSLTQSLTALRLSLTQFSLVVSAPGDLGGVSVAGTLEKRHLGVLVAVSVPCSSSSVAT